MDSEDGHTFVKNLASFVRSHERALANALHLQHQRGPNSTGQHAASNSSAAVRNVSASGVAESTRSRFPFVSSSSAAVKSAKLSLTPHHLFYLLSKFDDLGVGVGPMNVRLENLQHDVAPSNYVSFLGRAPKSRGKQAETESLRSVSSIRSAISTISTLWTNLSLTNAAAREEKRRVQFRDDITYLYACFTKIPALRLAPDHRARPVAGFEEFPFDTAVPLFVFKNVGALEICDLDFRQFHGWDRMSEQLRSLTLRRANVDDPIDLLYYIVLDDIECRRRRSYKTPIPTTPSTPGLSWPYNSPRARHVELARTLSAPGTSITDRRRHSYYGGSHTDAAPIRGERDSSALPTTPVRHSSTSPPRPISSGYGSTGKRRHGVAQQDRRSSGSSNSSTHGEATPRHRNSASDLFAFHVLPWSKWRFLRHLSLAENGLTDLDVTSLAPVAETLQSLDLSGNLFSAVPDALASLTHLRALNLSNCMIDSLKSLSRHPLPAITVLNLRANRLLNLVGIERLLSLERVDLRENKLHDPTELSRLTNAPDFSDVYVLKNPFTRTHNDYRVTIFNVFRSTPGRVEDITIDTLKPTSSEKKSLVDWAPEPATVPVVRPPLDDELDSQTQPQEVEAGFAASSGAATEAELRDLLIYQSQSPTRRQGHRRTTSDSGLHSSSTKKKKKPGRRRIVELSQQPEPSPATPSPPPRLNTSLLPPSNNPTIPRTPSDGDQPTTPKDTSYHTAATHQFTTTTAGRPSRPTLDAPFESPTPAPTVPRIRDHSDDEDAGASSYHDHTEAKAPTTLYHQKMAALEHDLEPTWLASGLDDPDSAVRKEAQNFSPVSCTSTLRPDGRVDSATGGSIAPVEARILG